MQVLICDTCGAKLGGPVGKLLVNGDMYDLCQACMADLTNNLQEWYPGVF